MEDKIHNADYFVQSEFLKEIPENERRRILKSGIRKKIEKGDILFHQGDPATKTYFLHSGQLKLTKLHEDGKEAIIRYIGPGELTAAAAVLRENEYPVTAEALCASDTVAWDKNMISGLMQKHPQIAINILCLVLERLEEMQQRFLEISAEEAERRIARALLRMIRNSGTKTDAGIRIDLPLTREDIADFTGTTHFTVSRILSAWARSGWISTAQRQITIIDAHSLVMLTENA